MHDIVYASPVHLHMYWKVSDVFVYNIHCTCTCTSTYSTCMYIYACILHCLLQLLDLTAERRRLLYEGTLTWRIQNRKMIGNQQTTAYMYTHSLIILFMCGMHVYVHTYMYIHACLVVCTANLHIFLIILNTCG